MMKIIKLKGLIFFLILVLHFLINMILQYHKLKRLLEIFTSIYFKMV